MLYIGIDGGGTKTKMVLFDEDGTRLKNLILPTVHVLTQPQDQAIEILRNGVNQLDPDHIAIIGAGLAGYGQQKELRDKIEYICKEAFGPRSFVVESDVRIAIPGPKPTTTGRFSGALADLGGMYRVAGAMDARLQPLCFRIFFSLPSTVTSMV